MASQGHEGGLNLYMQRSWWGTALFFVCDRNQLQDLLLCYIRERRQICNSREDCFDCGKISEVRERLNGAYFYEKRTDMSYQPIRWKAFLFTFRDPILLRLEILSVKHLW